MQNIKFKKGDIVRVTRTIKQTGKRSKEEGLTVEPPAIGVIVFAHPLHIFYTVEFRDRHTAEYKPMYRESFFPEMLEKIRQPKFFATRPAKKRSWAK